MIINKILPANCKAAGAILATTTLLGLAAYNNKNSKSEEVSTQKTEMQNAALPKYADLALYYSWETEKTNLKVENGVSFIADGVKYTSKDGQLNGEFIDTLDTPKAENKFVISERSFALSTIQTIKMVANFIQEQENNDMLILSKEDIKQVQSKIKSGEIWNEGKAYFFRDCDQSKYIGNAKITKEPNGAELDVNYMTSKTSHTGFYYE